MPGISIAIIANQQFLQLNFQASWDMNHVRGLISFTVLQLHIFRPKQDFVKSASIISSVVYRVGFVDNSP